jgi:hypothetical protein
MISMEVVDQTAAISAHVSPLMQNETPFMASRGNSYLILYRKMISKDLSNPEGAIESHTCRVSARSESPPWKVQGKHQISRARDINLNNIKHLQLPIYVYNSGSNVIEGRRPIRATGHFLSSAQVNLESLMSPIYIPVDPS